MVSLCAMELHVEHSLPAVVMCVLRRRRRGNGAEWERYVDETAQYQQLGR